MSGTDQPADPERGGWRSHAAWLIVVSVIAVGLLITGSTYLLLTNTERERQQASLASDAEQSTGLIRSQFARHETQLLAAQALFAGSDLVTPGEWRRFARIFQAGDTGHALFELAWIPLIEHDQLEWLESITDRFSLNGLKIQPPGPREQYCPILFNEPMERHAASLGEDVCIRRSSLPALQRSRELGRMALSEPLSLSWDTEELVDGYAMMAWIEANAHRPPGWVAGTFTLETTFDILPPGRERTRLMVFDESSRDAPELVYTSAGDPPDSNQMVQVERVMPMGGRELRLVFESPATRGLAPGLLLVTGMAATFLLAAFLYMLLRTRAHALGVAERMSRAYRQSEELLSSVTSNIFEGIYRGVPGKGLVYVNQSLSEMFNFQSPEEMIANPGQSLYTRPEQRQELHELLIAQGHYRNQEVEFIRPDGSTFIGVNNAVAIRDEDGNILYFDGVISDISERKRAEEQVHRLAHYDSLTGLPNRTLLDDRIRQATREAERNKRPLTVMFMDLDRFKTINDSLGHGVGDQLLVAVARRLTQHVRDYDTVSRQGGDEFILVLPGMSADTAAVKAREILEAFKASFDVEGHKLSITPSIGIAVFPDDALDTETLIRNADAAMYQAKDSGRSTFCFFTAELNQMAYERLTMETHLRHALEKRELSLAFQPLVNLETRRIAGAEALLRWHSPELGEVPPARFIPVAEQSGLIVEIGDWVIDEACRQLAAWRQAGVRGISLAINISAIQFWRGRLDEVITDALDRWRIEPGQLEIELTESVIMEDTVAARRVLAELKTLGIGLVIDDFGTGYSSLSYLKQFKIDLLKIDRSFVRDITTDPDDAAIISAIVSMARDLKFRVVAEGVETEEQLRLIRERGCHFAQGFLFSRPVPPDEFLALLESPLES